MTQKIELKIGDLLQLKPGYGNVRFAHCILIVEEIIPTGCFAYVQEVGMKNTTGLHVPLKLKDGDFDLVGHARSYYHEGKFVVEDPAS